MGLNEHDLAVIEQALREGIHNGVNYQTVVHYREVLNKLQQMPDGNARGTAINVNAGNAAVDKAKIAGSNAANAGAAAKAGLPELDGFRYDYDDSSELS